LVVWLIIHFTIIQANNRNNYFACIINKKLFQIKTYIYIILLCLPLFTFSQNQAKVTSVNVDITWDGRQCRGTNGICDISESNNNKVSGSSAIIDNIDNTIVFAIDRSLLSLGEELKIVGENLDVLSNTEELFYVLEYDFNFNINDRALEIAKGNYPIIITKETITITFNLK
jgi:hypothetical protein